MRTQAKAPDTLRAEIDAEYELARPFEKGIGHLYFARAEDMPWGSDLGNPRRSCYYLMEDGVLLNRYNSAVSDIQNLGEGRYLHWKQAFYFAASDNSDPNHNGRSYRIVRREDLYFDEAVRAAFVCAGDVLNGIGWHWPDVQGRKVAEIGPGGSLTLALMFAAAGADVVAVDVVNLDWDDSFHLGFCRKLLEIGPTLMPAFRPEAIQTLLAARHFHAFPLQVESEGTAGLSKRHPQAFDLVCSCAVLEHALDLGQILNEIYIATKPEGVHFHWVDFRYHEDFSRPLEFLLFEGDAYDACAQKDGQYKYGNRWRAKEFESFVHNAGFIIESAQANRTIDPAYLDDFILRLRKANSRFCDLSRNELERISLSYCLRRSG